MDPYLIEDNRGVLTFTINRPERRNAINYSIMEGLEKALDIAGNHSYKALVITGTGNDAFSSGGDLSVFHELKSEEEAFQMLSKMADILYRILTFSKPTVAILNGTAVGGGCELATACDFRLARKGIKVGFIQGKLAITTGWGGGTMLLEKLPQEKAMQLLMTAETYEVDQLMQLGFIDHVFDKHGIDAGLDFLDKIIKLDTDVLKAYKAILIRKWLQSNLLQRMQEEVRTCAKLWESDAHHIQVDRFLKK